MRKKLIKILDLFSGIGGFSLGLEATGHFETTCFVENNEYCRAVLRHHWPEMPVLGDICDVRKEDLPCPNPDIVVGGFPCQPFSQAGKQKADKDKRHLWPEMFRLIRECRPTWVVGENVIGFAKLGLDKALTDLENEGYATRTFNIPACATGAPHLRQRLWIIAHSESESKPRGQLDLLDPTRHMGDTKHNGSLTSPTPGTVLRQSEEQKGKEEIGESTRAGGASPNVADPNGNGTKRDKYENGERSGFEQSGEGYRSIRSEENYWSVEPNVGRLVNGLPNRVPQLRALGNSVIPQIIEEIGYAIKKAELNK